MHGVLVQVANNGLMVISALQRQYYNVILMDVQMPEMDGLETTRVIRQRWHDRSLKIIAVTSCSQKGDRAAYIQAGMDDYICKPVKRVDLDNALSCCHLFEP